MVKAGLEVLSIRAGVLKGDEGSESLVVALKLYRGVLGLRAELLLQYRVYGKRD